MTVNNVSVIIRLWVEYVSVIIERGGERMGVGAVLAFQYCTAVLIGNIWALVSHLRRLSQEKQKNLDKGQDCGDHTSAHGYYCDIARAVIYGSNVGAFLVVVFLFLIKL